MPSSGLRRFFCYVVTVSGLISSAHASEVHDAVSAKNLPRLKLMIAEGEDLDALDMLQGMPLHIAIRSGWVAGVEALLAAGVDPKLNDGSGTAIEVAASTNRVDILKLLHERGVDILAVSEAGRAPLHVASQAGALEVVEYLIGAGAPLDQLTVPGDSAAILAAENDQLDVVKVLHSSGADIALTTPSYRQTALHRALEAGASMPMIQFLVEAGSPLDSVDKFGETALDKAQKFGRADALAYLEAIGAPSGQ